ncbi:SDR family oxidoreductase [Actinopolyspora saharensis]|uniref:SDR family oxidoreductase n=1 Tax=Actinopolyspora saharensis TaxID=995062 RepID=UPI003F6699F9
MKSLGNILITGGASGLGAATVEAVSRYGGTPLVLDKAAPEADVAHARADLADRASAEDAVRELVEGTGGRLDAVFTAAGVDSCGALDSVSAADWERVVGVNLLGTVAVVRRALPYLLASEGTVVTCSSTLGLKAVPDATAYCASKAGVLGFSRSLAAETAGRVAVTTLVPGGMHTSFFEGRDEQYKPPADAKLNRPEDVAETVVFALRQPPGCEVREMVVCSSEESSWP